jgi:hypothetical protein
MCVRVRVCVCVCLFYLRRTVEAAAQAQGEPDSESVAAQLCPDLPLSNNFLLDTTQLRLVMFLFLGYQVDLSFIPFFVAFRSRRLRV